MTYHHVIYSLTPAIDGHNRPHSEVTLSASEGRVATHGFSRGIQGVCELVHTLGGLGHPEITRESLMPTL